MYEFRATGSMSEVAAGVRGIPARVIPYAASAALTKTAKAAEREIKAEMLRAFDRPVPYTLNSLRVVPATKDKLVARVAVKDQTGRGGTVAEDYIYPSVYGGGRNEKRVERALRYGGVLANGDRIVAASGARLDQYGNVPRGELQRILTALKASVDPYQNKTRSARSRRNAKKAPYFAIPSGGFSSFVGGRHVVRKPRLPPGIYRREGRAARMALFITRKAPQYRRRLDFTGVAERVAREVFPREFERAAIDIASRRR